jgi:hypothetical protein
LALLIWRLRARAMRTHVDTTRPSLPGWDKQATERPPSCMMVTQCAGGIVLQLGDPRHRARPLSMAPQRYLAALDVPVACVMLPAGSQRAAMAARRLARRQKQMRQGCAAAPQRPRGLVRSSPQELLRAWPGDKGHISPSLSTLEARGLLGISRSPGGKAEAVWLTPEGPKWASQLAGSCDEEKAAWETKG